MPQLNPNSKEWSNALAHYKAGETLIGVNIANNEVIVKSRGELDGRKFKKLSAHEIIDITSNLTPEEICDLTEAALKGLQGMSKEMGTKTNWWRKFLRYFGVGVLAEKDNLDRLITKIQKVRSDYFYKKVKEPTQPQSEFNVKDPKVVESIYALLNLGRLDPTIEVTSSLYNSQFTSYSLQKMLDEGFIPKEEENKIKNLISGFESTAQIASLREELIKSKTAEEFVERKAKMQERVLEILNEKGEIYFVAGYVGRPAGHAVGVHLSKQNGFIQGRIFNRGEGAQYHGIFQGEEGLRTTVAPVLNLKPWSYDEFAKASFLDAMFQLQQIEILPQNVDLSLEKNLAIDKELPYFLGPTNYSIHDFYNGPIAMWGGGLELDPKAKMRGAQRGGVCTMKAFLTPIRNEVSDSTYKHIKFRMCLDAFDNYLNIKEMKQPHILLLKEGLEDLSKSYTKMVNRHILTESEEKDFFKIRNKVFERINQIEKSAQEETIADFNDTEDYIFKPTHTKPLEKGKFPVKSLAHLTTEEAIQQAVDIYSELSKKSEVIPIRRLATEFLEALPPASSDLWTHLTQNQVFAIRNILTLALHSYFPSASNATSRQAVAIANTSTGILNWASHFKQDPKWGWDMSDVPACIGVQAATMLKILKDSQSQMRVVWPKQQERLDVVKKELQNLAKNYQAEVFRYEPPKNINEKGQWIIKKYDDKHADEDLRADPFLQFSLKNMDTSHFGIVIKAKYPNQPLKQAIDFYSECAWREHFLDNTDSTILFFHSIIQAPISLFATMGPIGVHTGQNSFVGYAGDPGEGPTSDVPKKYLTGISDVDHPEDALDALNYSFQDWEPSEKELVRLLLNPATGEGGITRQTQNAQIKIKEALRKKEIKLGGKKISSAELELLLTILTSDETLIPQCIRYFDSFPHRLEEPKFQALFEAILWTKSQNKNQSVLEIALKDPTNRLADHFIASFKKQLQKAQDEHRYKTQLILTRFLSQMSMQLANEDPAGRQKKIQEILQTALQHLEFLTQEKNIRPENKSEILHWIVSYVPYLKVAFSSSEEISSLCQKAVQGISKGGLVYRFLSPVQSDDFETAMAFASSEKYPEDHLPQWILKSDHYVLPNVSAKAKKIIDGERIIYDLIGMTPPTKIEIYGSSFQIIQQLKDMTGKPAWFAYQPQKRLVRVSHYDYNHPINGYLSLGQEWRSWDHSSNASKKDSPEIVMRDANSGNILYRIVENQIIQEDRSLTLSCNLYNSENPFHIRLLNLDEPKNTLIWRDKTSMEKSNIERIEYPRLNLFFQAEKQQDGSTRFMSSLHKGFFIDPEYKVKELEPFNHYLALRNKDGAIKVIMANKNIAYQSLEMENQATKRLSEGSELISYDIDSFSHSIKMPSDPYRILYLIHLAMRKRNYERAREFIAELERHPAEWSKHELSVTGPYWTEAREPTTESSKQDPNPKAAALRLRLRMLQYSATHHDPEIAINDRPLHDSTRIDFFTKNLTLDYRACIEQMNSLGPNWLPPLIEKQMLKLLHINSKGLTLPFPRPWEKDATKKIESFNELQKISDPFIARAKELEGVELPRARKGKLFPFSGVNNLTMFFSPPSLPKYFSNSEIQKEMLARINKPAINTLTIRPGQAFILNFLYYYKIAKTKQPAEEYKMLMDILRLSMSSPNSDIHYLRRLLLKTATAKDSEGFHLPEPSELIEAANKGTLHELLAEHPQFSNLKKGKLDEWGFSSQLKKSSVTTRQEAQRLANISSKKIAFTPLEPISLPKDEHVEQLKQLLSYQPIEERRKSIEADLKQLKELESYYSFKSEDPCVKSSCDRTIEGIQQKISQFEKQLKNLASQPAYTLDLLSLAKKEKKTKADRIHGKKQLASIKNQLKNSLISQKELLKIQEESLLALIHDYPAAIQREIFSGKRDEFTLDDLIIFFSRNDDHQIVQANPNLEKNLLKLKKDLVSFLIQKGDVQLLERASQKFEGLLKKGLTSKGLINQTFWRSNEAQIAVDHFLNTLTAKRAYQGDDPFLPSLLAFETLSDIRLREDQIQALKDLRTKAFTDTSPPQFELEARTGFGKSTVFIPLWLYLTSQEDHLTMMTVPTALLPDQERLLKAMLGRHFKTGIHVVKFDRSRASNIDYLKQFNERLAEAIRDKRVLLFDISSLHGLSGLALKEALLESSPGKPNEAAIELAKIRNTFKNHSFNFIDESRVCLYVRADFGYAVGKPTYLSQEESTAFTDFYRNVVLNQTILKKWKFEFLLPHHYPKDSKDFSRKLIPTEDNFPLLQQELTTQVMTYLKTPKKYERSMRAFLMGGEASKEIKDYLTGLKEEEQTSYAFCRKQLNTHLKRTLLRQEGERYGLLKNSQDQIISRIAIPYNDSNPKPSSEFASVIDLGGFTLQANLKNPFDEESVQEFVNYVKQKTPSAATFDKRVALFYRIQKAHHLPNIHRLNDKDIQTLTQLLNEKYYLDFIETDVLPNVSTYPEKVSGTSFNLIGSQHLAHSASGTVDPDTLPPPLKPKANPAAPIGNLLAMKKHSKVEVIDNASPLNMLNHLITSSPAHSVLIDAAGLFRDLKQETIAIEMLKAAKGRDPEVKGIVFYDNAGNRLVLKEGEKKATPYDESQLPKEKLMTFIRQSKAVGSDTPMMENAKGFVTVGRNTMENFLLQGAGRMRGLESGQTVDMVLTQEDAKTIAEKLGKEPLEIGLKEVLQYAKLIEAQQKGNDYFYSLRLHLENLIEQSFWKKLNAIPQIKNEDDLKEISRIFHEIKELLVESTRSNPVDQLFAVQKMMNAQEAIQALKQSVFEKVKNVLAHKKYTIFEKVKEALGYHIHLIDLKEIEKEFDAFVNLNKLPQKISLADCEAEETTVETEQEVTQETEQEQLTEQEVEQEQLTEQEQNKPFIHFHPAAPINWTDYTEPKEFEGGKTLLGISIAYSENYQTIAIGQDFDKLQKIGYHYILKVKKDGSEPQMLFVDIHDYHNVLNAMKEKREASDATYNYYLISGSDIQASDDARTKPAMHLSEVIKPEYISHVTLLSKILAGSGSLSLEEAELLKSLNPSETKDLLAFVKHYVSVWPHLKPLANQIENIFISI